jgi:hypothetical protein
MGNQSRAQRFFQSALSAQWLAIGGLTIIFLAGTFQARIWSVDLNTALGNLGALLLIVGVLQWFFDNRMREAFLFDIKQEIIGNTRVADSGICDFYENSRDVDFREYFLSSSHVTIGVNYSSRLIDNAVELLGERHSLGKTTTVILVDLESPAGKFLMEAFGDDRVRLGQRKVADIVSQINRTDIKIDIKYVRNLLRYSFVRFDSRIWIVPATNSVGRRSVPGFFVKIGSPWFNHLIDDCDRLTSTQNAG